MAIKKIGNITLPLLKMVMGQTYYVRFLTAMAVGKVMPPRKVTDPATGEVKEVQEQPATVAQVTQYDADGKSVGDFQVICSAVLGKELKEAFANDGYVGRAFGITQFKLPGKRYNGCTIEEVEIDDGAATTESASAPAPAPTADAASAPAPAPAKGGKK